MLEQLSQALRRLFGLPTYAYPSHKPRSSTVEGNLSYGVVRPLGLSFEQAYHLLEPGPLPPRFRYRHLMIPKRDGGVRQLMEPGPALKAVQQQIIERFLKQMKPHRAALGFRRRSSIAHHAWAHAGQSWIITADIQDFFPSTNYQRVRAWWRAQGYGPADSRLLTTLTTYRGSLPQGAPTSPMLSNLLNIELDRTLEREIRVRGGRYTRYADDMAFSWSGSTPPSAEVESLVRMVLAEYGYLLHGRKGWQVWRLKDEPQITGLVLTRAGGVDLPPLMKEVMRQLKRSDDPHDQRRLQGYEGYASMVTHCPG